MFLATVEVDAAFSQGKIERNLVFSQIISQTPFSLIQFPLWEYLKKKWSSISGETPKPW